MTELPNHEETAAELQPGRVRRLAEGVLNSEVAAAVSDRRETDKLLSEQLQKDVADPSTRWQAYESPPIGLVTPATVRATKPENSARTFVDAQLRKNNVGGRTGEQLGVPNAQISKPGAVITPRTPEIRQGLAEGEGILLSFERLDRPPSQVVYFVNEAARRADVVSLKSDGTIRHGIITNPDLVPKTFTIGERGQFDPATNETLSGLKLQSVELPSTMMKRLGVIDPEGIPTTVPDDSANIQFVRQSSLIDQAKFLLEAQAGLNNLPTTQPG